MTVLVNAKNVSKAIVKIAVVRIVQVKTVINDIMKNYSDFVYEILIKFYKCELKTWRNIFKYKL